MAFIILVVSLLVRLYQLPSVPVGFYVDEAAQGYNAYLLLTTGRDEHNHVLPLYLQSFGTYPPALFAYFATVPIKLFGLSVFSVRLTSAVIGSVTVLVFAILCQFVFSRRSAFLLGGLLLAINPTHVLFSRGIHEPTLGLLIFLLGVTFLYRRCWTRGLLLLSLSTYAYQPQRLIVYPLILGLVFLFRKKPILPLILFGLTQLPNLLLGPSARLSALSWWPTPHPIREFLSQYLAYFSPRNLFWLPDPDLQRSLPQLSVFYSWLIIPFVWGIPKIKKHAFIILLLLVSPLAAALTRDPFSTSRASPFLIPLNLIILAGLLKKPKLGAVLLIISTVWLYRSLFVLLPLERYQAWNYGYETIFASLKSTPLPIVVDTSSGPVYILYLFFTKAQALPANVSFRSLVWSQDIYKKQIIVATPLSVSPNQAQEHFLQPLMSVYSPGHQIVLTAYSTDPVAKCHSFPDSAKIEACSRQ